MNLSGSNSTRIMSGKRPRFFLQNAGNKGTEKQLQVDTDFPTFVPPKLALIFLHYSKSQIFVQKFNFDKTLQFFREFKVDNN